MTRSNGAGHHRAERHCAAIVIKIRYRDASELSPGLHATAEQHGRSTTVYLLPGLTGAERKAALRRLRLAGRMGYGPRLALPLLAFALIANRIRTAIAQAGSVWRAHPAGTTGPAMLISAGAIAFVVLSAVSIHILREPRGPDRVTAFGPAPAVSAIAVRIPGSSQHLTDDPDGPAGSEGDVLTTVLSGSDPLFLPTPPDPGGTGSGIDPSTGFTGNASTGNGSTGNGSQGNASNGNGSAGQGTGTGTGGGGTTAGAGTGSTSPSNPAPSSSGSGSTSGSDPAPAPVSVSASVAPSVSVSVSAADPVTVSASVAPSVSASVPASAYTSVPVSVSASASVSVSASVPASGSLPSVSASVTGGACLDVGPLGVCLGG